MSFGKNSNSSKASTNSTQNTTYNQSGSGTQTETPNNLPYVQQGWDAITNLLHGTSGNSAALANTGINLTANAGINGATAAGNGLKSVGDIVGSGATNGANAYLTPIANGSQIGAANPGFQGVLDQVARGAQQATDGSMGAAGRYGSGADANAFHSAVSNTAGQLGYQNYADSQARQMQAAQQLSGNNTNSLNQVLAALGMIPNLSTAGTDAGAAVASAGAAPATTFAQLLAQLGNGGGTASTNQTQNGTSNGTSSGTSKGSSTGMNFGVSVPVNPISLFG